MGVGVELRMRLGVGFGVEAWVWGKGLESRLGSHLGVDDVGEAVALLDHLLRVQVRLALRVVFVRLRRSSTQRGARTSRLDERHAMGV